MSSIERSPLAERSNISRRRRYVSLDFANSGVVLAGGHVLDLVATPGAASAWLHERKLAPADAGMREQCAAQLRVMRQQVRALLAARVEGFPPPDSALRAVNDAMTRVPTAAVLRWDADHGLRREAAHPTTQVLDHAQAALAADAAGRPSTVIAIGLVAGGKWATRTAGATGIGDAVAVVPGRHISLAPDPRHTS
jgi:hypothetical protein